MGIFSYPVERIRLGEFDMGGVLYHSNYFHLYESAREAILAEHGLPYSSLVARGEHLALVESHQRFFAPIRYGEPVLIELYFSEIKRSSFAAHYRFFSPFDSAGKRSELHRGLTRHAFISTRNGAFAASRIPPELIRILEQFRSKTEQVFV